MHSRCELSLEAPKSVEPTNGGYKLKSSFPLFKLIAYNTFDSGMEADKHISPTALVEEQLFPASVRSLLSLSEDLIMSFLSLS